MYAMSPDSGVRFCGCCRVCVMMLWYGVDSVCSVANGLVFMVVVLDMVVLFMDWNGGLEYLVCGLTWFHDDGAVIACPAPLMGCRGCVRGFGCRFGWWW